MSWSDLWSAMQGIGTVGAVIVALGLQRRDDRRHDKDIERTDHNLQAAIERAEQQRRSDQEQRRREQQRALYIQLTLRIAEDYEVWRSNPPAHEDRKHRIGASLSALPIEYLQVLRHEFGVYPDARDTDRISSYGDNRYEKARQEITALLYNLTGAGTNQDYEPPGSPAANRLKRPPYYP